MYNLRNHLLSAPDTLDPGRLPPRFAEAQALLRAAITQAEDAGIADVTLAAVLVSEAMPRLVGAFGPVHAARLLAMFSRSVAADLLPSESLQ
jgi:hypothetical protein